VKIVDITVWVLFHSSRQGQRRAQPSGLSQSPNFHGSNGIAAIGAFIDEVYNREWLTRRWPTLRRRSSLDDRNLSLVPQWERAPIRQLSSAMGHGARHRGIARR